MEVLGRSCVGVQIQVTVLLCTPRYITRRAETDLSLPRDDCNTLRYSALRSSGVATIIVGKLQVYGDLVENIVQEDEDIRESDEAVIQSAFRQRDHVQGEVEEGHDGPQQEIDYTVVKDHLHTVMQKSFSKERVAKSKWKWS